MSSNQEKLEESASTTRLLRNQFRNSRITMTEYGTALKSDKEGRREGGEGRWGEGGGGGGGGRNYVGGTSLNAE